MFQCFLLLWLKQSSSLISKCPKSSLCSLVNHRLWSQWKAFMTAVDDDAKGDERELVIDENEPFDIPTDSDPLNADDLD